MRVFEITGAPGSGKSTVVAVVKEQLENHNIAACTKRDLVLHSGEFPFDRKLLRGLISRLPGRLYRKCLNGINNYIYLRNEFRLRFFLEHLAIFEELDAILTSIGCLDVDRQRAMKVLLSSGGLFQMATDAPSSERVFLLDEGFTHRAISLFVSRHGKSVEDPTIVENYIRTMPLCHAVICVHADLAKCVKRLHGRGLPERLQGASDNEVESYISNACDVIDVTTATLKELGIPVIDVDNNGEPFSKNDIANQLERLTNLPATDESGTERPAVELTSTSSRN